jgi:hypothetical protein
VFFFYGELLAPRPTPKLEDHPLSAVRDCLFNIFTATLHIGGRSSIRNLRTRHAVMTGSTVYIVETPWNWLNTVCPPVYVRSSVSRLFPALDLTPYVFQLVCPVRSLWRDKKCGCRASRYTDFCLTLLRHVYLCHRAVSMSMPFTGCTFLYI